MIERFFIKKFLLYPFINRFRLWGGLIFLHRFARRGIFFGWLSSLVIMGIAIGLVGLIELPLGVLKSLGLPVWIHFLAGLLVALPFSGLLIISLDLFLVGARAPKQPVFGNLLWSASHDARWNAYIVWLEEQRNGAKE
jgi:hypothetical protein